MEGGLRPYPVCVRMFRDQDGVCGGGGGRECLYEEGNGYPLV